MVARKLIAIVDDDDGVRLSLSGLIRSAGYAVRLFDSAEGFLADLSSPVPDCLLTVVHMPGMTGLELLVTVRAGRMPIPVLVMSGRADPEMRGRALAAGASEFLSKPFDSELMLARLEHAISRGA